MVPPNWGTALTESDHEALAGSWITPELAEQAMLRRVDSQSGREAIGQRGKRDCAGILIPYYWPCEPYPFNYRIRRDNPEWTQGKDGQLKATAKYLGPPKCGNRIYVPPGITPEQLADLTVPIVLTEGEKKALALWRLACDGTDSPRFVTVAIAGVWNWRGVNGKASDARGARVDTKGPIADLSRIPWEQREVFILFDANVTSNEQVEWARIGIARELTKRKATVKFINLPDDCGVNGVDDLLAKWGAARVLELFNSPVAAAQLQVVLPPQFDARPTGLFRVIQKGERLSQTQLTNFCASIKTNICLDDGLETKREFELEADLLGRSFRFTLPASKFAGMDWPLEQMGPAAITYPNQREYARTAIQGYSMTAEDRTVYTHTGWRKIGSHWFYLHSSGAIGAAGAVDGIHVRLVEAMSRYSLRLPKGNDVATAVRASLQLLELGPASVSFPLLAATYRSAFGASDFSIHLVGETGAFKSELAALQQQHFGAAMSRKHLPASWSSTANAIEALTFHAKDALIVVDDFAPQGSAADVSRAPYLYLRGILDLDIRSESAVNGDE